MLACVTDGRLDGDDPNKHREPSMRIREPAVAGQFYPAAGEACRKALDILLEQVPTAAPPNDRLIGGLVPHAGWVCSGAVAAGVLKMCARACTPDVVVFFGGVHRARGRAATIFPDGQWNTPLGSIDIDARLAERILSQTNLIVDDPHAHEAEHSIEVQVPFLVRLFPDAKFVPVMVPTTPTAHEVGQAVARTLRSYNYNALVIGTTDLTHYGPNYGFVPNGIGVEGNTWAKEENDPPFIELVCSMKYEEVVAEARARRNACSSGAAAATMAACASLGASRGDLLQHTSSAEVLASLRTGEQTDSVGYAGIVFS